MVMMMMRCMMFNIMIESTTKQIWQGLEYSLEFSLSCPPVDFPTPETQHRKTRHDKPNPL